MSFATPSKAKRKVVTTPLFTPQSAARARRMGEMLLRMQEATPKQKQQLFPVPSATNHLPSQSDAPPLPQLPIGSAEGRTAATDENRDSAQDANRDLLGMDEAALEAEKAALEKQINDLLSS